MVWQKLEPVDINVLSQAVNFQTRRIVNVGVLFLGDSKHGLVVEPLDVPHRLIQV